MIETAFPLGTILLGWVLAGGSPGPATLTISATSMDQGRAAGLAVAAGVVLGSATWGVAAGLGLSAVMLSHVWLIETVRYAGAAYLLYLAIKSLRSAWRGTTARPVSVPHRKLFRKGLLLHLTNPKAILAWGSIYAISLRPEASVASVWGLFVALILASMVTFFGYALLFAIPRIGRGYRAAKRGFDALFGLLFGAASVKILTARLT